MQLKYNEKQILILGKGWHYAKTSTILIALGAAFAASTILFGINEEASGLSSAVGRWTFNNGNPAIASDNSGAGNDGTINGATVLSSQDCEKSHCLNFDGLDDFVSVPNSPTLNFGSTESFSISLWMKSSQSGGDKLIVDKRRNNDGIYQGYSIEDNSGLLIGIVRDSAANDVPVFSTTNVNDGNFHHIVYVIDRSTQTAKLYVDNFPQATASISSVGSIDSSVNLLLGGQQVPNTPVDFYSGTLDQVTIYNQALSPSEIRTLFVSGS